jgi:transcriptional regulator with XRE-family HTH domain
VDLVARSRSRRQFRPELARAVRLAAQISVTELAAELNVTPSAVSRWEQGQRRPRGPLAEKYAAALARLEAEVRRG